MALGSNQVKRTIELGLLVLPLLLAAPVKAHGYTDPGIGTFAYQAVYAAFVGGTFYFRKLLKRFFSKRSDK